MSEPTIARLNTITICDKARLKEWRRNQDFPVSIFGINWKNSADVSGLLITKLPPITRPKMRTQSDTIDGRDGDVVVRLGYEAYDKEVEFALYGEYYPNDIIAYLTPSDGGYIIFSDEPDCVYEFQMYDEVGLERLLRFRRGKVKFHVQPYKYRVREIDVLQSDGNGGYQTDVNTGTQDYDASLAVTENDSALIAAGKYLRQIQAVLANFRKTLAQLTSTLNAVQSLWVRTREQLQSYQSVMNAGNAESVPIYAFRWIPSTRTNYPLKLLLYKGIDDPLVNTPAVTIHGNLGQDLRVMLLWLGLVHYNTDYNTYVHNWYTEHPNEPVDIALNLFIDVKEQQCKACITSSSIDPIANLYAGEPLYSVNQWVKIPDWDRLKLNPLYNLVRVDAPNGGVGGLVDMWIYRRSRLL